MDSNQSCHSTLKRCKPGLGTYITLQLEGGSSQDALLDISVPVFDEIERIERLMSFHDPDSELSRLNREGHRHSLPMSSDMEKVLKLSLQLSRATQGLFDVCVARELVTLGKLPDHGWMDRHVGTWQDLTLDEGSFFSRSPLLMDLGGIAKGYAVDQAARLVPADLDMVLNAGGDLIMRPWQDRPLAIRHPLNPTSVLMEVPMKAACAATSGCYFSDGVGTIIRPTTSLPDSSYASITVFASSCMLADALTKVVALVEEPFSLLQDFNAKAVVIDQHGHPQWLTEA